jgi:nitroreductase
METLAAITTRRAVRQWDPRDIPGTVLHGILEAGRCAPSPLNSQPWHFTVVRKRDTIGKLMEHARHGSFLSHANVVIAVTVATQAEVDDWLAAHEQHLYCGVCAMQNMWLAAWDQGLGVCWVTLDEPRTRQLLGIPAGQKLLGSLALGYAVLEELQKPRKERRPLEEMVSYEEFGNRRDGAPSS